jgi:uncharacterized protein YqhQ
MKSTRKWIKPALREALHMQLLIALESGESEILVGGQAVMEGVMMRAPHSYAVAVRRSDGTISTTTRPLLRPSEKHKVWGWPMLRGLATLGQAMGLGVRALRFSSELAMADEGGGEAAKPSEVGKWGMIASIAASVIFFVAFYKFMPLVVATETAKLWPAFSGQIAFNLVDGIVRIVLFLAFIGGLALLPDIRRVYEYHGAEHKVVYNYESGQPVDVAHARGFTTLHPRCGTSFMIVIMLIAMAMYILIPATTFWMRFGVRLALLPVIAGLSYEVIRFGAKHSQSVFALLARPGLWLQRITTVEPSDSQLEISIHALQTAMSLEKEQGGEMVIA